MLPAAAVLVAALLGLWSRVGPQPRAAAPIECERAALVDGSLRCDDEVPTVGALCPTAGPVAQAEVMPGDSLHTAQLCARSDHRRGGPGWSRMAASDLAALRQPVEINLADVDELSSLPRVGPAIARRIVEGRPYREVDDLLRVRGIGPVTLEALRPRAVVQAPPTP